MQKFNVTGMSCAACSARVEKAVSALEEVSACSVNLLTNSMTVEGSATDETIIAAVTEIVAKLRAMSPLYPGAPDNTVYVK